jgi:ubiquinone/menaquinone biosynthesis C-methylase UbiE
MDVKHSVQSRFGAAAVRYADSPVHATGVDLERLLREAGVRGGERVLDLGCGPGHTALALAARGCEVIGLDLTEPMLEQARRLAAERGLRTVRFERGDVEALPYPEGAFDRVTSRLSAHHYPDPQAALCEVARVLRPGGVFLLSDTIAPEDPAQDTFLNAVELLRDPSHVRNHTPSQWIAMAARAGLGLEPVASWMLELDFDAWIARMGTPAAAARQIRATFRAAPSAVRAAFGMRSGREPVFSIPLGLFRGSHAR